MGISDTEFEAANRRGGEMKASFPAAVAVRYDRRLARIFISLSSGMDIAFAPRDVRGRENALPADLVDDLSFLPLAEMTSCHWQK